MLSVLLVVRNCKLSLFDPIVLLRLPAVLRQLQAFPLFNQSINQSINNFIKVSNLLAGRQAY